MLLVRTAEKGAPLFEIFPMLIEHKVEVTQLKPLFEATLGSCKNIFKAYINFLPVRA